MTKELFLVCALSIPASNFTKPPILSYQVAKSEEDQLVDWLKKNGDVDEVFITNKGDAPRLKEWGYERVPFTHKGREIWIRRNPKDDQKKLQESA